MTPGVAQFCINMPQFSDIKIHLPGGLLQIKGGRDGQYINSMRLNGKAYNSAWIDWDVLKDGGTITYKASAKPNKKWGLKRD